MRPTSLFPAPWHGSFYYNSQKLARYPQLDITVSTDLQQNATADDLGAYIDIADWLIRYKTKPAAEPAKKHCVAFLKSAKYINPDCHKKLEGLIKELDLEFIGE